MKIIINSQPSTPNTEPVPAKLNLIQQPKKERGLILSVLIGLIMPFVSFMLLGIESVVFPRVDISADDMVPWWVLLPVFIVCLSIHELLHLIWHPGGGFSKQSIVLIWPQKFQLGVYYDGFMTRSRWLVMRLSPLVGLTLLPTVFLLCAYFSNLSFFWQQFTVLVILVNSLGVGSDLLASIIVFRQVPSQGEIGIWNGRAYWR